MCIQESTLTHVTLMIPKTCLSIMLNYQWNTRIDMSLTKLHQSLALINSSYHSFAPKLIYLLRSLVHPISILYQYDFRALSIYFSDLCELRQVLCKPLLTHSDYAILRMIVNIVRSPQKFFFRQQDANLGSMTSNLEDTVKNGSQKWKFPGNR